jgi:hypothetical protein
MPRTRPTTDLPDLDHAAARLRRSVEQTLRPVLTIDSDMRDRAATLAVPWLMVGEGRFRPDSAGRLRLSDTTRAELRTLGRTLQWMSNKRAHKGQQAAEIAAKTMRGLAAHRLTFPALLALATEYRSARHKHVRANAQTMARAPACSIDLEAEGAVATRIVTVRDLRHVGQLMGNCLSSDAPGRVYAGELRDGVTEFWRIDVAGDMKPRWCLSVSVGNDVVCELQHGEGRQAALRDRRMLLAFLVARRVRSASWTLAHHRLRGLWITNDLIRARVEHGPPTCLTETLDGTRWNVELTDGALAAWSENTVDGVLLRHVVVTGFLLTASNLTDPARAGSVLNWTSPASCEDECEVETFDDASRTLPVCCYVHEISVKSALRAACRRDPPFRAACAQAFRAAPDWFVTDWFGADDRPTLNAPPARPPLPPARP